MLVAGAANVAITRANQRKIAALTAYSTKVALRRDGAWTEADSTQLVPGDVVRLKAGGWLLPADLLLLSGTAIVNESSLTGESMPVRKAAAPATDEAPYETSRHARHTLFAGTAVLQLTPDPAVAASATPSSSSSTAAPAAAAASTDDEGGSSGGGGGDGNGPGGGDEGEVLAKVVATGIATGKGELIASILYPAAMVFKYDEELPIVVFVLALCSGMVRRMRRRGGGIATAGHHGLLVGLHLEAWGSSDCNIWRLGTAPPTSPISLHLCGHPIR